MELNGPCRNVLSLPKVGTSEYVSATPVARLSGYRLHLGGREWEAAHVAVYPSPLAGRARVVVASPFLNVQMRTSTGDTLSFSLVPLGCA